MISGGLRVQNFQTNNKGYTYMSVMCWRFFLKLLTLKKINYV